MRSVTTTPSCDQSKAIAPPSWADMLRCTSLLPKPSTATGTRTGGPPRSVHTTISSSPAPLQDTSKVPLDVERAPYLVELVASSWRTRASVMLDLSPTLILGTET